MGIVPGSGVATNGCACNITGNNTANKKSNFFIGLCFLVYNHSYGVSKSPGGTFY